MAQSILTKETVEHILAGAKNNLANDGYLCPALFLHLVSGEKLLSLLKLPETFEARKNYLVQIGQSLFREGKIVAEAVIVIESWFVKVQNPTLDLATAPSEHQARQEAIVVIGRDRHKTRTTSVIQAFSRDQRGKPVWQPIEMAHYNEPADRGETSIGLLDFLFTAMASQLSSVTN